MTEIENPENDPLEPGNVDAPALGIEGPAEPMPEEEANDFDDDVEEAETDETDELDGEKEEEE